MAVLHITYKREPDTSNADYEGVCDVLKRYAGVRLSDSNWVINTGDAPKILWQKLMRYIDPNDYLVIVPLDARSWSPQDGKALKWLLSRP